MKIEVIGGTISEEEKKAYVDHVKNGNPNHVITELKIELDGEFVNLTYKKEPINFQRIRRITGYLVGTLDRFNNAKRTEVDDRVKHDVASQ